MSFYLEQANFGMNIAGTWRVEVSDQEVFRGIILSFDMIIVAGCQKQGPNEVNFSPIIWPLEQTS